MNTLNNINPNILPCCPLNVVGIACIFTLLGILLSGLPLSAQPHISQPKSTPIHVTILFSAPESNREQSILDTVRTRLSNVPVALRVRQLSTTTDESTMAQLAVAQLSKDNPSMVVYWRSETGKRRTIHFWVQNRGKPRHIRRNIGDTGEMSEGDVVALIAVTTIELFIENKELFSESADIHATQHPSLTNQQPRQRQEESAKSAGSKLPRWFLEVGYGLMANTPTPRFSQMVRTNVGFRLSSTARLYGGLAGGSAMKSTESQVSVIARMFPVYFGGAVMTPHPQFRVGLVAGVAVVPLYRKLDSNTSEISVKDSGWKTELHLESLAKFEIVLRRHLNLFGALGGQLALRRIEYRIQDGPTLFDEYWIFRPVIWTGLQVAIF